MVKKPTDKVFIENLHLYVDKHEVSVMDYALFVSEANYLSYADSTGMSSFFNCDSQKWEIVNCATWQFVDGQNKSNPNLPVTHVTYQDAYRFCTWKGGRLPSAHEWDSLSSHETGVGNTWQGNFPVFDYGSDGYSCSPAVVGTFLNDSLGLYDLFGNVWEWTSSQHPYTKQHIIKGGSFLCDKSVCAGYFQQNFQYTDSINSTNHIGFRCVYDEKPTIQYWIPIQ